MKGKEEILLRKNVPNIDNNVKLNGAQINKGCIFLNSKMATLVGMLLTKQAKIFKKKICYKNDRENSLYFKQLLFDIFNEKVIIRKNKYSKNYTIELKNKNILDFLYSNFNGIKAKNKFIPNKILEGNKIIYKAFLKGFLSNETLFFKKDKIDYIEFETINIKIRKQLQVLLSNIGIAPFFTKNKLRIYDKGVDIFKTFGFVSAQKKNKLIKKQYVSYSINQSNILKNILLKYEKKLYIDKDIKTYLLDLRNKITEDIIEKIYEDNKNDAMYSFYKADTLSNIGIMYQKFNKNKEAIKYFEQA